jgi:hypothetical protein
MYNIAIPTLSRHSIINSLTLATLAHHNINPNNITIFVIKEEYEAYREAIDKKYKIVIGEKGLVQQRHFIENYYPFGSYIVFLDDDIKSIDLSLCETQKGFETLDLFFITAFEEANNCKSHIWSVYPVFNKFFRKTKEHKTLCLNYMVGAFYGIINRPNDKELELKLTVQGDKEDVERSILYFIKDGKTLRFNQIGFETKYYGSVGGLGTLKQRLPHIVHNATALLLNYGDYGKIEIRKNGIYEFVLHKKKPQQPADYDVLVGQKFPSEVFDNLYSMLNAAKFHLKNEKAKNNRRGFPKHKALIFGVTRERYSGVVGLSSASLKYPHILEELEKVAAIVNPTFVYTSIHINHNLVCPKHHDEKNVGKSMLISIGDYTGCNIVVQDVVLDSKYQPVLFNGSCLEHYNTNDLVGNKYSIIYYNSSFV